MADTLTGFPDFFRYAVWQLLNTCGGSVGSGSRTNEEQSYLYKTKGPYSATNPGAAAPGTSHHEVGVAYGAADMEGNLDCMHANAERFGLYFPMENEPWHIEPSKELIDQGMAFFGEVPTGQDPNAATAPEDPMDRVAKLLMGDDEGDVESAPVGERSVVPAAEAAAAPENAAAQFAPTASAGFSSPEGGAMSAVEVAQTLAAAGFSGEALVTAVAVSYGESGWNPGAVGDTSLANSTWGPSMGLMQIRTLNAERNQGTWRDASRLADPLYNAKAAYAISNGGTDFGPWTIYSNGAYLGHMDEARAAVAAIAGAVPAATAPLPAEPETSPLDDLLAADAQDPGSALEGTQGEDIVTDNVGREVNPQLGPEEYASA